MTQVIAVSRWQAVESIFGALIYLIGSRQAQQTVALIASVLPLSLSKASDRFGGDATPSSCRICLSLHLFLKPHIQNQCEKQNLSPEIETQCTSATEHKCIPP